METILFLAHTESDGTLGRPALEALGAAKSLATAMTGGTSLTAGLFGQDVQSGANAIAACGAARILGVSGDAFGQSRYASDAAAAEALVSASGATLVVAPATSRCARALPGVAYRVGGRVDTHVVGVSVSDGAVAVTRWYYRQRMEAVLKRAARPWILLIDPGAQPAWAGTPGTATVESVSVVLPDGAMRTNVTGVQAPASDQQTIRPDAELLFVAGAGWTKPQAGGQVRTREAEVLIRGFIDRTKASLGGSKSLVDQSGEGETVLSLMTHLNQIGQTGSTPRHRKGLSTCCHGEEPHVVGWRFITERRAVNLNANCGWAQGKTDVLYVADAFEVVAKINALLGEAP